MRSRRGRSAMETSPARGWERKFERWLAPFLASLKREAQRHWAPIYLKGLLLPGERKSVEPLAARVAPGDAQQLHHFIGGSPWVTGPLQRVLAKEADKLVGGAAAGVGVGDTALRKQGKHSRSEKHTSETPSRPYFLCRLFL